MKYPTDMVTEDGWTRIHSGHNLDREILRADMVHNHGEPPTDHELHVDEWHLGYAPRVKWCEQYGWPCDNEGEWHAHWYQAKPNDHNAFTVVSWQRACTRIRGNRMSWRRRSSKKPSAATAVSRSTTPTSPNAGWLHWESADQACRSSVAEPKETT